MLVVLCIGAFIGSTISGLIGMAGGSILLAVMLLAGLDPLTVVPIHAAVQLVSNSTRVYAFRQHFKVSCWAVLALAALPGPIVGLWCLQQLDAVTVKALMGVAIICAAWAPKKGLNRLSDRTAFGIAGALAGTLGVIVGAVGPLLAPFFLRGGFKKESIIGTKAGCQATIHIIKIAAFSGLYPMLLVGEHRDFDFLAQLPMIVPMALTTKVGTYTGKSMLRWVSEKRFILIYKVVLTVLGARLLWDAWANFIPT